MPEKNPLLSVEHIEVTYKHGQRKKVMIRDVSFKLYSGEMVALTGKSGAGKSMVSEAIVGLLDKGLYVTKGQILFEGENIVQFSEKQFDNLRRNEIAMLIQHSLNGLDPIRLVNKQMLETIRQKQTGPKKELKHLLNSLLSQVGFDEPEQILESYPFELSGGMRQRVLLAMMLSLQPKILIADEPTTALDAVNREKVLRLFKQLQRDFDLSVLLISHDENSVKKFADRVVHMDEGGVLL